MTTDTSTAAGRAVLHHDRYPTLDELTDAAHHFALRYPELCRVRTLGTSREGRPLILLTIGHGPDHVLALSGAHADEFSGRAGLLELAHRVLARPDLHETRTWHLLLCLDPDGAHLAEGSLTARTLPDYFAGYYRPAADEQPEWAPAIGGRLPESRILLDLIDELRPSLQLSLHTADVGGTFTQCTFDAPALAEPFAKSAAELAIPIETGSYDTFRLHTSGPGVFLMAPHHIDHQEHTTGMLTPGAGAEAGTWFAPQRHGGGTVIVEVPAFTTDHLGDTRPADDAPERLTACAARLRERGTRLTQLLDAARPDDSALLRALHTQLTALRQLADQWDPHAGGQDLPHPGHLTRAQLAGIDLWSHRIPVRAAALLRRAAGPGPAGALLRDWCAQYERRFAPVWLPVARQAAHHANTAEAAVRPA
ncbi:M14 family zinc carboxypeptidase [Streptomyces sp. FH025]|uniref:M14 family zinc carboxypeptidase n=1 Tax=Streptomyces sp. FH025 TaxID=2815937 RepID=UPI001A9FCE3F|nr:M14 family zinc carboxypeptidase [Streptomyces sp. FH025]MBO1415248.1 hydroxylacyl-CoA dehydrogenase [Streptomyces sp. FH025]